MNKIFRLFFHVFLCIIIGSSGAYFTAQSINTWYPTLIKPAFNPPNYLFGPVWTLLFTLLGVSLWGIISNDGKHKQIALSIFIIQFIFNIAWSFAFFGLQNPSLALIDIILLLISIAFYIKYSYSIKPWIAFTQIPYLLWVSFATILNASIVYLN